MKCANAIENVRNKIFTFTLHRTTKQNLGDNDILYEISFYGDAPGTLYARKAAIELWIRAVRVCVSE